MRVSTNQHIESHIEQIAHKLHDSLSHQVFLSDFIQHFIRSRASIASVRMMSIMLGKCACAHRTNYVMAPFIYLLFYMQVCKL